MKLLCSTELAGNCFQAGMHFMEKWDEIHDHYAIKVVEACKFVHFKIIVSDCLTRESIEMYISHATHAF